MSKPPKSKPLTTRYTLILLLTVITAAAAGFLFYSAVHSVALAILTGSAAFAGSWRFYDETIA